jgi:hypothetical protein
VDPVTHLFDRCQRALRTRTGALRVAGAAAALLVVLAGCGNGGDDTRPDAAPSGFTTVTGASLTPGDDIPAPADDAVLTVDDGTHEAVFDLATLERAGLVEAELFEPFDKARMTFRGVELAELLAVAGIPAGTDIHLTALDDYVTDLTAEQIEAGGILVASRKGDGSPIAIEEGGPIRLVFLDGVDAGVNDNQWIWSISRIDARR